MFRSRARLGAVIAWIACFLAILCVQASEWKGVGAHPVELVEIALSHVPESAAIEIWSAGYCRRLLGPVQVHRDSIVKLKLEAETLDGAVYLGPVTK